jgi:hypothetical protein
MMAMTVACQTPAPAGAPKSETLTQLEQKIAQYAPVPIGADVSKLPPQERNALKYIVDAARLMDPLFLEQAWAGNPALLMRLAEDHSPEGQARLHYFLINKGPFDRIDHLKSFLDTPASWPTAAPETSRSSFYPADATRTDLDTWLTGLKGPAHDEAVGFFTVVRRDGKGQLMTVPYSVAYGATLGAASALLRQAAAETAQPTLKRFLELRADAFRSNDYYASDMAWMELDASIEPTIGPYETYEDDLFGYKAAFEAFVTIRDDAETQKLATFGAELQGLEDQLPIDAKYRNPKLGALAPIRVVNVIFAGGDGNRGVQTAAFNLPNDDRVIKEKGSKRVMLKNVQDAKFQQVLLPIAKVALRPADQGKVSFDAFFTHIVMHEVMHGLGPHQVTGTQQPVRLALKDTYAALEEAKADISGLWALQQLADKGALSKSIADSMYTTFLASAFRSIRFGVVEAHGKGIALQLNTLLDRGGFVANADGTFAVNDAKIRDAVSSLTHDLMTIEAEGRYDQAKDLLARMGVVRPEVQKLLDRLANVPVDIEPTFTTADQLTIIK